MKQQLEEKFPGKLEITGEATRETSGKLEVQVVGGDLLHSKANGDGYVDTGAKLEKIFAGVEAALR